MAVSHLSYVTIALLVITMTAFSIASVISVPSSSHNPADRQNNPHPHHHNHHRNNKPHHRRHHLQETAVSVESGIPQDSNGDSASQEGDVPSHERLQVPAVDCPTKHFFSVEVSACLPCSGCPSNQIVRRPCSARADTWCTPFFEFHKFKVSPASSSAGSSSQGRGDVSGEEGEREGGERSAGRRHHHKNEGHINNNHPEKDMSPEVSRPEADLTSVSLARARSQWRTLSLALITVLAVVCVLVVVVGMYVCVVCRRTGAGQHKNFYREPELLSAPRHHLPAQDDTEPRYVDTYITSRDRLRDARHLPVYHNLFTGSDDVQREFPPLVAPSSASSAAASGVTSKKTKGGYLYFNLPAADDVSEA